MTTSQPLRRTRDVEIAGEGLAAAAIALRLLRAGYRPALLRSGLPMIDGIESIPHTAWPIVEACGLSGAFARAGAALVDGFENALDDKSPSIKRGAFWLVSRQELAREALAEAFAQGAESRPCRPLSQPDASAACAFDATGRFGAWSRPLEHAGDQIADLYGSEYSGPALRGRIVKKGEGWAYRFATQRCVTVGILGPRIAARRTFDASLARRLGLDGLPAHWTFVGRRPAFVQWAQSPCDAFRFSVGDAAVAHDPIAGQGMRFALGSAIASVAAAHSVLQGTVAAQDAVAYYSDFVCSERLRHLSALRNLRGTPKAPPGIALPKRIRFATKIKRALRLNGDRLAWSEAVETRDGALVRFAGGFDLLDVRALCIAPTSVAAVLRELECRGLSSHKAELLLRWCAKKGLIE